MITLLKMFNTNRLICSLSHDAMKVRQQDALAVVEHFVSVSRLSNSNSLPISARMPRPESASGGYFSVKAVLALGYVTKICNSVVSAIMVDVVNNVRLLPVNKEPSKPMGVVKLALKTDPNVAVVSQRASNRALLFAACSLFAPKHARVGIIVKEVADRFWNNAFSHLKLPLHLVRGLTAPTVSTPILSWRAAL